MTYRSTVVAVCLLAVGALAMPACRAAVAANDGHSLFAQLEHMLNDPDLAVRAEDRL